VVAKSSSGCNLVAQDYSCKALSTRALNLLSSCSVENVYVY
jgi:hypothetical protein